MNFDNTMPGCPECGKPLQENVSYCKNCRWPHQPKTVRKGILAYGFFLLLMLVLGIITLFWAWKLVPARNSLVGGTVPLVREISE